MSSPSVKDFRQHSEDIARKFLQTIMVVDDRAYFEEKESPALPTEVITPGPPRFTEGGESAKEVTPQPAEDSSYTSPEETQEETEHIEKETLVDKAQVDKAHELNAKKLIENFAKKGMVCAVIRPKDVEVEALGDQVYPLAETCDIVVFDWVLYDASDGRKVKELIGEITKRSSEKDKRLRLIVVYTGQLELADIAEQIKTALEAGGQSNVTTKNSYTLEIGPVRIAVYAKGFVTTPIGNEELAARIIPIDRLPDKLINEFTDMTMGLVSNVAVQSLAALRSNTHHILSKFHPGIDAPFLAHRAMLTQPDVASDLLVYLIGTEITAILDGEEVGKVADVFEESDIIKAWLDNKESEGYSFAERFSFTNSSEVVGALCKLLRSGIEDEKLSNELKIFKNKPHKKALTEKFCQSSDSANDLEYQFAVLSSIKSDYRVRPPALLPGSLLKETRELDGKDQYFYWVCIQPACDSFRITSARSFPFLELELVEEGKPFNLVIPDRDKGYVRVKTVFSPHRSRMEVFDPTTDGLQMVRAEQRDERYYFTAKRGTRYEWIAELKIEHAQRIVNEYAAQLSRVGLDESEWLRRWAG